MASKTSAARRQDRLLAESRGNELLQQWLTERLRVGDVPRISDAYSENVRSGWGLRRAQVGRAVRENRTYAGNLPQMVKQRGKVTRHRRPILAEALGHWHADIGYFALSKRYATPKRYRAGYLVAKDVLSRMTYAVPLDSGRKDAKSMTAAFGRLIAEHDKLHPGDPVKSVSFDRETSVMSAEVQRYLRDRGIAFHPFRFSRSKAKHAENAIRLIRTTVARLMSRGEPGDRWWTLLKPAVDALNGQPIEVNGRNVGYCPRDVNLSNLSRFRDALERAAPEYYFGKFEVAPDAGKFRFKPGDLVRAKLAATSSHVIGEKRSEQNLTDETFVVEKRVPYVTRSREVGKGYLCRETRRNTGSVFFEEDHLVAAAPSADSDPTMTTTTSRFSELTDFEGQPEILYDPRHKRAAAGVGGPGIKLGPLTRAALSEAANGKATTKRRTRL